MEHQLLLPQPSLLTLVLETIELLQTLLALPILGLHLSPVDH